MITWKLCKDVESGKAVLSLESAFEDAPYCIDSCNDNIIATGDEGGVVRLFDIRKKNPVDELLIDDGKSGSKFSRDFSLGLTGQRAGKSFTFVLSDFSRRRDFFGGKVLVEKATPAGRLNWIVKSRIRAECNGESSFEPWVKSLSIVACDLTHKVEKLDRSEKMRFCLQFQTENLV